MNHLTIVSNDVCLKLVYVLERNKFLSFQRAEHEIRGLIIVRIKVTLTIETTFKNVLSYGLTTKRNMFSNPLKYHEIIPPVTLLELRITML